MSGQGGNRQVVADEMFPGIMFVLSLFFQIGFQNNTLAIIEEVLVIVFPH